MLTASWRMTLLFLPLSFGNYSCSFARCFDKRTTKMPKPWSVAKLRKPLQRFVATLRLLDIVYVKLDERLALAGLAVQNIHLQRNQMRDQSGACYGIAAQQMADGIAAAKTGSGVRDCTILIDDVCNWPRAILELE